MLLGYLQQFVLMTNCQTESQGTWHYYLNLLCDTSTVPMLPLNRCNKEQYCVAPCLVRESTHPLNTVLDLPLKG